MRKWLLLLLSACALSFANVQEEKGLELCSLTGEVFKMLRNSSQGSLEEIRTYERKKSPELAAIAQQLIALLPQSEEGEEGLGDVISSLGRLVKCSVDDTSFRWDTPFLLHKKDIQKELALMETELGDQTPSKEGTNYHRLMMESLADQRYELALYAYLKIAETRCLQS